MRLDGGELVVVGVDGDDEVAAVGCTTRRLDDDPLTFDVDSLVLIGLTDDELLDKISFLNVQDK